MGRHGRSVATGDTSPPKLSQPQTDHPTTLQLALRAVNDALAAYAANPALRAVITVIPFVSAFDALVGTAGSNLILERLRVALEALGEAVQSVERRLDTKVEQSELYDAAIRAVRGALETGSKEKVRMLAAALVGATSSNRPAGLDVETVLASLSNLTPSDLSIAARLAGGHRLPIPFAPPDTFTAPTDLGPDVLFFVTRLQGAGLLEPVVLPATPQPPPRGFQRTEPMIVYRFTPTFERVMQLLAAGGMEIRGAKG